MQENQDDTFYELDFDVYRDGEYVGHVHPSVQLVQSTQQQKLNAGVIGFPLEDLFVVYKGVNDEGAFAMDVRVNPLVTFVWVGFGCSWWASRWLWWAVARPSGSEGALEVDTADAEGDDSSSESPKA